MQHDDSTNQAQIRSRKHSGMLTDVLKHLKHVIWQSLGCQIRLFYVLYVLLGKTLKTKNT